MCLPFLLVVILIKKYEKEVIQYQLDSEKAMLKELEKQYKVALNSIDDKIATLLGRNDANLQNVIFQVEHQKALRRQVEGILNQLHSNEFDSISDYLATCYEDGFIGTMYSVHNQGIPLILPFDQNAATKAIITDSKINTDLYTALGVDVSKLKKSISSEITRGIAAGMSYNEIARNVTNVSKAPLSRAKTIVRTEAHRIQEASAYDAQMESKKKGANVVRQWKAVLDGNVRNSHMKLDGQTREMEEPFELGNKKAMFPGDFGDPAEDCNCRCRSITRARWALDDNELQKLKDRAAFFGLDKTKDFKDFKEKYLNASKTVENTGKSAIIEIDELTPCLRRLSDNKIVSTSVFDVSPTKKEFKDWEFDWTIPKKNGFVIRGIKADGDDRFQGLVALKPDKRSSAVQIDIVEAAPFNNPHNKLFIEKEYSGIGGHLFAEAVRESFNQGFNGYVYFVAKSDLIEHYEKELGAVLVNPRLRIMAIEEGSAKKLYERYYQEK